MKRIEVNELNTILGSSEIKEIIVSSGDNQYGDPTRLKVGIGGRLTIIYEK